MKSLMAFVGILAFNSLTITMASDFSCPVAANKSTFTCSGTVKVKTLAELNAYRNDLGVVAKKPTIAKNLQIDFNPALTSDLIISTPCTIKVPENVVMTSTANICLYGAKGVSIGENFNFNGKNLKLESKEEVVINKTSVIKAQDIKLLSIGSGDTSKSFIRDGANIEAANLSIESFDKGFVGKNSIVKLTGALGIYSLGDDEASVREGSRVEAAKIEISSTQETRVAKATTLVASEIVLNGVKCTINKTAVITATDRLGNCFLTSTTNKARFTINKNQGTNPLTVNFNASTITDAKGFIWSFGDGETLNSLTPNITHIYNRVGSFTATLKYATKDNYKGLKSAGAIQIDVKAAPPAEPVQMIPPRGYFNYQQDGTLVYLKAFIKRTQFDIANAYYIIDDNPNFKVQIPNFYANATSVFDIGSLGRHKATMHVVDVQGQTYSKSMNLFILEGQGGTYPFVRLDADQSGPRTMYYDFSTSFATYKGAMLKDFTVDFGDGQTANLVGTTSVTHTYAQAGTYYVVVTAMYNGEEGTDELEIEVTDENTPIMNPIAAFDYSIYNYAGNVLFTDERSGTPNGEIISYVWDFGDGTIGYGKNASNFYAPGDYLVTLTVTDTAGMRASQTQKITIVAEGEDIASMLNCRSDWEKHLRCETVAFDKFNEIVRVKLDWGDGTSENLTVADLVSTGFSVREHNYQNYGKYNVELTIDTSRASRTRTQKITLVAEGEDIASMLNCRSDSDKHLICETIALDRFDEITNVKLVWGDGTNENLTVADLMSTGSSVREHDYQNYGTYIIELTIDTLRGQTKKINYNKVFSDSTSPVDPVKPNAVLNCYNVFMKVICDSGGSTAPMGNIISYKFNLSNGEVVENSTGILNYEFISQGSYTITLTIKDNLNQTSLASKIVNVFPSIPTANMICDTSALLVVCNGLTSFEPSQGLLTYEFDMGDGAVITNETGVISYSYEYPGLYNIKLKVTNKYNNSNEYSVNHQVLFYYGNMAPIISAACSSTNPLTLDCYLQYSTDDGFITSYTVDFGDQILTSGDSHLSYRYEVEGLKNITIIVTDNQGKSTTGKFSFNVIHNNPPTVELDCRIDRVFNLSCVAMANANDNYDQIIDYSWDMGDSSAVISGLIPYAEHIYNPGTYEMKLTVRDQYGGVSTVKKQITILENQAPSATVTCTPWTTPVGDDFLCNGYASDSDGSIVKYFLTIDGKVYNSVGSGVRQFNGGETIVYWTVIDDHGKQTTAQTTVVVVDRPRLEYSCTVTRPYHLSCNIDELPRGDQILGYGFRVEDTDLIVGRSLEYDFTTSGIKSIKGLAFDELGKEIIAEKGFYIAKVYQAPRPRFISYVNINKNVKFDALESYIQDRKIESFHWSFGDGSSFTDFDEKIEHTFPDTGSYVVTLTVLDKLGNSEAYSQNVYVYLQEVDDPGGVNEETAIGVDSDSDYVRDDIQRWISYESKGNDDLKFLLKKLAKTYQIQIINSENKEVVEQQEKLKNKIEVCLLGKLNDDDLSHYYSNMLEHFYKTTKLRSAAYTKAMGNTWGVGTFEVVPAGTAERLMKCSEI